MGIQPTSYCKHLVFAGIQDWPCIVDVFSCGRYFYRWHILVILKVWKKATTAVVEIQDCLLSCVYIFFAALGNDWCIIPGCLWALPFRFIRPAESRPEVWWTCWCTWSVHRSRISDGPGGPTRLWRRVCIESVSYGDQVVSLLPRWSSDWLNMQKPVSVRWKRNRAPWSFRRGEVFCVDAARMSRIWMGKLDENGDKP
jgi:hypothetical protein